MNPNGTQNKHFYNEQQQQQKTSENWDFPFRKPLFNQKDIISSIIAKCERLKQEEFTHGSPTQSSLE